MYEGGVWKNVSLSTLIDYIEENIDIAPSTQTFEAELIVSEDDEGNVNKETHEAALVRIVGDALLNEGDIAVIKDQFNTGVYQYTAYVYNGTAWAAMDGNYNARNVYFDKDFTFTEKIGTVKTLTNGSTEVAAAGKNLYEFFAGLFAKESTPTPTTPSVKSLTLAKAGSYEAGTELNSITYEATFEDGKYDYGPEPTGVKALSWNVTDNKGNFIADSATGNVSAMVIQGDTNFFLKATATYSDGDYALSNLGNVSTTKIKAGTTASQSSAAITGYWQYFYGVLDTSVKDDVEGTVNSAFVRGNLTHGGAYSAKTLNLNAHEGAKCLIVAAPASKTGITEAIMPSALQAPIPWLEGAPFTVSVNGATNAASTDYNVWIYEPASMDKSETYKITLG